MGLGLILTLAPLKQDTPPFTPSPTPSVEPLRKPLKSTDIDGIYKYLTRIKIVHPTLFRRLVIIESGHGRSRFAKQFNNVIGMKFPERRKTTAIGKTKSGYAIYNSVEDCLEDLKIWSDMYLRGKGLIESKNYIQRVYGTQGL